MILRGGVIRGYRKRTTALEGMYALSLFGILGSRGKQERREITIINITDPEDQKKLGLLLHNGARVECVHQSSFTCG